MKKYRLRVMRIKRWVEFNEANIPMGQQTSGGRSGGVNFFGDVGPNYGRQELRNTISTNHTGVIHSELNGRIYSHDDWQSLYIDYLKSGGTPISNEFNKNNLDTVINYLQSKGE